LKEFSKIYYLYIRCLLFIFFNNIIYCFYYIVYIVSAIVFIIVSIIFYIEIKEIEKSAIAKNDKKNNREVFWARRDNNFYCITNQLNRTNNKDFTTIIFAKSLLSHACKFYCRCFKRSLDKIEIDRVLFYSFEDNKENNTNL